MSVAPGTYFENLDISKPITLEGHDTVLMPGGNVNASACTQPAATGDIVTGICIHGTVDVNFEPVSYVADVTIKDITSTGWSGDGAFAVATDHLDVHDGTFANNGGYGIFAFHSKRVHYHDSVSHDNGDAGFFIGESPQADVRVSKNNKACPASEDAPPFSGIGIAIGGDTGTRVRDNRVSGNAPGGPSALPTGGIVMIDTTPFGGTVPTNNRIVDNRLKDNAPVDVFSDGSGSGNRFHENRCSSSVPGGLCS